MKSFRNDDGVLDIDVGSGSVVDVTCWSEHGDGSAEPVRLCLRTDDERKHVVALLRAAADELAAQVVLQ